MVARLDAPGEQDTSREQRQPTLRLALAMRGGVSLAVWIGGAVAELDVLRRATKTSRGELSTTVALPEITAPNGDAEQKRLRELRREERRQIYRDLLELADIDHVEIDVLAGASAGGLNAVLYGTALANGKRIDDMREIWAQLAELPALLRPTAKQWGRLVPSPLRGDEYFYVALQKRLSELAKADGRRDGRPVDEDPDEPKPAARYLTVTLSATVLPKIDQRGVREQRERGADSGRASFGFDLRPTGGQPSVLSDLPTGDTSDAQWRAFMVDRLALAGRSTASFPGGFEPARVYADERNHGEIYYHQRLRRRLRWPWKRRQVTLEDSMSRYQRRPLIPMPDMVDVFSATRPPAPGPVQEPFGVVDGGVFDNIAIGRALTAIAHSAAEVHTRRWLIYLDPDPVKAPVPKFGSLRPPAFTVPRLLLSLAGMRAASRTVDDDLEALQQYNERAQARRAATEAFSRQLIDQARGVAGGRAAGDPGRAQALWEIGQRLARPDADRTTQAYARYRASSDLPRLTRLLVRPQLTISAQIIRTKGFNPWSDESIGEVMLQVREPVQDWYVDSSDVAALHLDLTAVIDTADFLIAWTRVLELWHYRTNFTLIPPMWKQGAGDRKRIKRVLYRVLFLATALRDIADQEMLDKPGSAPDPQAFASFTERVRAALGRVHRKQAQFQISSRLHEFFHLSLDELNRRTPAESDATFHDAAAAYLRGDLTDPDRDELPSKREAAVQQPANRYLWMRLTELFEAVRRHSSEPPVHNPRGAGDHDPGRPWRGSPFHLLTAYPELIRPPFPVADGAEPALANLGLIFAGAGGLPDSTQMVNFDTFTADQFSPLYQRMRGLRSAVKADWARSMLRGRMPDVRRPWLDSRTKLTGDQLANFAGLLDRRWRNNDWLWGRADSAANTVSLFMRLVDSRHLATGKRDVVEAANKLATRVGAQERDAWSPADLNELGEAVTKSLQLSIVNELLPFAVDDEKPERSRGVRPAPSKPVDLADFTTGQETPAVLPPKLRSGLIMHGGLLFFRATLPGRTGPRTTLMRAAAQVLRPVFVLALLLAMPARAALLLGLVLTGAAVSDIGGPGHAPVRAGVLAAIAFVGCLLLILRADAAGRRIIEAGDSVEASAADVPQRELITSDRPTTTQSQLAARDDAVDLANEAVGLVRAVHRRRLVAAVLALLVALGLATAAWRSWSGFAPWLEQGNWAAFAGLVATELGAFLVVWRASERPLRARTGRRAPTQPRLIWTLAAGAVGAAFIVGHIGGLITTINPSEGSDSIADGDAWLAITVGAVLLCAMIAVSTFDWMRSSWLVPACLASLAVYGGVLIGLDGLRLPNTVFGDVLLAALVYGGLFTYGITVFCPSRYPGRDRLSKEPSRSP